MKNDNCSNIPRPAAQQPPHSHDLSPGQSQALTRHEFYPLVLTDRAQKRRAARFLARLRRAVLPAALILVAASVAIATTSSMSATLESADAPDKNSFGFLRLISPKKAFYVGEIVPVELKACFRAGVELRVDGLPRLNGDAFTMNKLGDQPERSQQVIGAVPYTVFSWSTAITAVKAGDYELSVEIPTTVTVRQQVQRPRARTRDPFGDSFFDDVLNDEFFANFFGAATQKQVALSSLPGTVKILSLPAETRPPSFSGAVGTFDLTAEAAPIQTAVGDPVTLKLRITGSGNFDRVNAPAFEKTVAWKPYKPSAKFESEDSAGYTGAKTFEQALVPTQAGNLEIPAIVFSFFDPETKLYVTRTTTPLSIEVVPGQTASPATPPTVPAPDSPTVPAPAPAPAAATATSPDMVPNKLTPGVFTAALRPWFFNPWLAISALVPAVALIFILRLVRRQQKLARDPHRARLAEARHAVQAQLRIMEGAVSQGAVAEFFAAARGAFQSQLGLRWGLPPQTITLAEINVRMNGEAEGFRFILELADEVTYTGRTFAAADLQKWFKIVNTELKKLETQ